ncbi:WXG100-like domain-containing protein [Streptomyces sp. DW26H14]|uniref:WXG100-like domain-containing protein n=1 Tax=Streptomyces sp. DW26H14 TaxID=3435395 RepID=UPI00403DCA87
MARYWPDGHQDKPRDAASAYRTASTAFQGFGRSLHTQVQSLTDDNSDESVSVMAAFWATIWQDGGNAHKIPLSAAHDACGELATACDKFAHAIDEAHSGTEHELAEADVVVGLTTAVGLVLTLFTAGGSDAGAAALDGAEAGAILGGVEAAADAAVTERGH